MADWLELLAFLVVYIVALKWILPALGVPT